MVSTQGRSPSASGNLEGRLERETVVHNHTNQRVNGNAQRLSFNDVIANAQSPPPIEALTEHGPSPGIKALLQGNTCELL